MTNEEFIESISLPGEEWRDVVGNNRYAISSLGRVLAYSAPYKCGNKTCFRKPHLLKPRSGNTNPPYLSVVFSDGNTHRKSFVVHRLVAMAFIANPNNFPFVNHKDEDSKNNCVDNLEWCTQQYNCNYGTHNARMAATLSKTAYQKRKVVQLTLSGDYINTYDSIREAANYLCIEEASISICCRKPNRTGRGFRWMYLSDYESLINKSKN